MHCKLLLRYCSLTGGLCLQQKVPGRSSYISMTGPLQSVKPWLVQLRNHWLTDELAWGICWLKATEHLGAPDSGLDQRSMDVGALQVLVGPGDNTITCFGL